MKNHPSNIVSYSILHPLPPVTTFFSSFSHASTFRWLVCTLSLKRGTPEKPKRQEASEGREETGLRSLLSYREALFVFFRTNQSVRESRCSFFRVGARLLVEPRLRPPWNNFLNEASRVGPGRTIAPHSRRFNAFRLIVFLSPGVRASFDTRGPSRNLLRLRWRELFDIERIFVACVFFFFFFFY